jgi:hypothetical protein
LRKPLGGSAGFEQAAGGGDVARLVQFAIGPGLAQPGHRGQVKDHFDIGHQWGQVGGTQVGLDELKPIRPQQSLAGSLP